MMDCSERALEYFIFLDHMPYLRGNHYVYCKRCKYSIHSVVTKSPCKGMKDKPRKIEQLQTKQIEPYEDEIYELSYKDKKFIYRNFQIIVKNLL